MGKDRKAPEIPTASLADIAFLLLVFFLVTTTIAADKGISVKLPPWPEDDQEIEIVDVQNRNVLVVLINSADQLLVEGAFTDIKELKGITKEFVDNNGRNPELSDSPSKAIVSLKNDRGTSYDIYIQVQNELKAAYNELRDATAKDKYGKTYAELRACRKESTECKERADEIKKLFPLRISEAEPETY